MKKNDKNKVQQLVPNGIVPTGHLSRTDRSTKWTIITLSVIILLFLCVLVGFIVYKSVPALHHFGFFNFIFGGTWNPAADEDATASYGIGKIIVSTLVMLFFSLLFAVLLTIFGSLFICEYLGPKAKRFFIIVIQLLAGIPSVVFGLFALDQIGSIFMLWGAKTPGNLMTASLTLAIMALPTMMTLSIDAIDSVPDGYRFASLGLGTSKERTTFTIVLRTSLPKIITAIITGIARIIGETMAVILIAGNSTQGLDGSHGFTGFIFSSIRTLAGTIGLEMLENSGSYHESALYAIGLILFFVVIFINLLILGFSRQRRQHRSRVQKTHREQALAKQPTREYGTKRLCILVQSYTEKRARQTVESIVLKFFMVTSLMIVLGFIVWILVAIFIKGISGFSAHSFIELSGNRSGIFATAIVTILLVVATITFAVPLALIVAIYLAEYSSPNSKLTKVIRFAINILASTPSIVFGVFGFSLFISIMHIPMSVLASSITMTFVVLPSMITVFEDSLKSVPKLYKEAAYGMGLGKAAVIIKISLPSALRGMLTGLILTVSRIIGESAPVYLTLGTSVRMPTSGFLSSGATMTTEIYMLLSEGTDARAMADAYLISFFTIVVILLLNWLSHYVSQHLDPSVKKYDIKTKWKNRLVRVKQFSFKRVAVNCGLWIRHRWLQVMEFFKPKKWKNYLAKSKIRNQEIKRIKAEVQHHGRANHESK